MNKNIVFSFPQISLPKMGITFLWVFGFFLRSDASGFLEKRETPPQPSLLSLIGCTMLITMISGGVMVYTLITYT
ncbi:MAG: hypothetical protein Ct9H300mP23_07410 [Nitrospinota bacterium]|nr:MAG: hypothetical protein Ct9H300mP23_07410 [Nitrospinota bacterium]